MVALPTEPSVQRAPRTNGRISIIVPVLNEAALITPLLLHLRRQAPGAEIIVVDGGSSDGTPKMAAELCDCVVTTCANRAVQMNAGAKAANGEVLWFVHEDAQVPPRALREIERVLSDRRVVGGYFRIALPQPGFVYRLTDTFAHYAGLLLRMRCGDHAIFCRRDVFELVGGFPEVPLMEDVEFFRSISRHGRMRVIPCRLTASARRYERVGPLRLSCAYGLIAALYFGGMSLTKLD